MRIVPPKSYRAVGSPRGQERLVALSAGMIDAGVGPRITSSCHCSSNPRDAQRDESKQAKRKTTAFLSRAVKEKNQISMTMDIYSHVLPTLQRDVMNKLNDALQG